MKSAADSDSFRSDDGRVEVVFDLDELSESKVQLIISAAVAALDAEHKEGPDHVTLMITGDERIRELNKAFNGEDEVTDVLSFSDAVDTAPKDGNDNHWPEFPEISGSGDKGSTGSETLRYRCRRWNDRRRKTASRQNGNSR